MIDFEGYREQYECNFTTSIDEELYDINKKLLHRNEEQMRRLFDFVHLWKDRYRMFCEDFDAYLLVASPVPIFMSASNALELEYNPLPKVDFYIYEFFDMIINYRAKFDIQNYKTNYDFNYTSRQFRYNQVPDYNFLISGNKFHMIGKDNNYRLDIKMTSALICSLLYSLSNNHNIYKFYHKSSKFRDFIDKISTSHYFVGFQVENHYNRVLINGGVKEPHLRIDIERGWIYFIYQNEIIRIENQVHYNHLDDLFGKSRTKPLTSEDLELYHMINGKYPSMYDFDIKC